MGRRESLSNRQFWESATKNTTTYIQHYNRLTELAISMFEWINLPETVDPRFLELALFRDGMSVFFKDEVIGYLSLRTMIGGALDVYQIPTERTAYASNGYNRQLNQDNSVIIFNNMLHTNSMTDVELYSKRLYDIDCAIDINAKAQKTPLLVLCDQEQRLTLLNVYKQYDGNEPVIFGNKTLATPDSFKVLQTGAPYVADKLYALRSEIWGEVMTYLGISNLQDRKKERVFSYEVAKSQGTVFASRFSRLNARKQACEEINKMFGLDIDVKFRDDFDPHLYTVDDSTNEDIEASTSKQDGGGIIE